MGTYSFISVQATIAGPGGSFSLGYGAGNAEEGISIETVEEKDLMTVGADGSVMHSLRASDAARITVRLLKTSPVNAALSLLYNFQKSSPANWGQNVFVVSDTNRGDVETVLQAAFARPTPNNYGKDGGMNEWLFFGLRDQQLGSGDPSV